MGSSAGDTAIIVPVSSADTIIGSWRLPYCEPGLPAHITALYPFKPLDLIDSDDRVGLQEIALRRAATITRFAACGRFPSVSFLEPDNPAFYADLTADLERRWPDYPPYGGVFDEVHPHLTIAEGVDTREQDGIERIVHSSLPYEAVIDELWLIAFDGERWQSELRLPFAVFNRP